MPVTVIVGPFTIHTYTLLITTGILTGLLATLRRGPQFGISPEKATSAILWALAGAALLGRGAHVAANWTSYAREPWAALEPGRPFAFYGLLMGGILGLAAYTALARAPFWPMADTLASGAPLLQFFGWGAALVQGIGYGRVSYSGWAWELPDTYGIMLPRIPAQFIGLVVAGIMAVAILMARPRRQGALFCAWMVATSAAYLGIGFVRGDSTLQVGFLRASQAISLLAIVATIGVCVGVRREPYDRTSEEYDKEETR